MGSAYRACWCFQPSKRGCYHISPNITSFSEHEFWTRPRGDGESSSRTATLTYKCYYISSMTLKPAERCVISSQHDYSHYPCLMYQFPHLVSLYLTTTHVLPTRHNPYLFWARRWDVGLGKRQWPVLSGPVSSKSKKSAKCDLHIFMKIMQIVIVYLLYIYLSLGFYVQSIAMWLRANNAITEYGILSCLRFREILNLLLQNCKSTNCYVAVRNTFKIYSTQQRS